MNILEQIRTEHGLRKIQMAKRLGITKGYYSMLSNDDCPLSKNVAIKVHQEFGIPLEQLLCRPEVQQNATSVK